MNPVWKRELRARWRGWRAFALVFFYVAVLATIFAWQYNDNLSYQQYQQYQTFDPSRRMSLLGHNLFVLLAWLQIVLWMLLAPIITATAITTEREKGLLEGLHLSRLRPVEIVFGKLGSALSLIALLIIVTLPIVATCFLMGGVSPTEFMLVTALHAATAICCATVGLAISAWCRNGMAAIALAIVAIIAWSGLAFLSLVIALGGATWMTAKPVWPWNQLFELFAKAHPIVAILEVIDVFNSGGGIPWTTTTPSWIVSVAFLFGFTLFNLWLAARGTRRLLANRGNIEWQKLRRDLKTPDATNLDVSQRAPATPAGSNVAPKTKRFELGFLSRLHFSNPVLGREARACFRPRSTSLAMLILAGVLLPLAAIAYAQGLYWAFFDSQMRLVIGPALLVIFLILAIGLGSVLGAGALAREREGGTWEALRLSLLSPGEILWGKLGTPLLMCVVTGGVFLPVLLPCVRSWGYSNNSTMSGISLTQLLGALAVIAPSAWFCALLGLTFSHFSKKPVTAICWTLGVLFVVLVVGPLFYLQLGSYSDQRAAEESLKYWHPVLAVTNIFNRTPQTNVSISDVVWPCALGLFITGAILNLFLLRELRSVHRADKT